MRDVAGFQREDLFRHKKIEPNSSGKMVSKKKQKSHDPSATSMPMRPIMQSKAIAVIRFIARAPIKMRSP